MNDPIVARQIVLSTVANLYDKILHNKDCWQGKRRIDSPFSFPSLHHLETRAWYKPEYIGHIQDHLEKGKGHRFVQKCLVPQYGGKITDCYLLEYPVKEEISKVTYEVLINNDLLPDIMDILRKPMYDSIKVELLRDAYRKTTTLLFQAEEFDHRRGWVIEEPVRFLERYPTTKMLLSKLFEE